MPTIGCQREYRVDRCQQHSCASDMCRSTYAKRVVYFYWISNFAFLPNITAGACVHGISQGPSTPKRCITEAQPRQLNSKVIHKQDEKDEGRLVKANTR